MAQAQAFVKKTRLRKGGGFRSERDRFEFAARLIAGQSVMCLNTLLCLVNDEALKETILAIVLGT